MATARAHALPYLAEPHAGRRILDRCDALARHSLGGEGVTRLYLSPEHRQAAATLCGWMEEAGMTASLDAAGNIVGRYGSVSGGGPYLILGSHQDSVKNGGKYDGPLGVVTAIDCVAELHRRRRRLPFGIEVVAFGDEEGTRFRTTLAGSRAIAGTFGDDLLQAVDADGKTMREAMIAFGLDPAAVGRAAHAKGDVLGYVELHIEQGPILEKEDLPICAVTAISGQSRSLISLVSAPNHAGTVPMHLRHDPLLAASEIALAVEKTAIAHDHTVATVGSIRAEPGLMNVVPGNVTISLDLRSEADEVRKHAYAEIVAAARTVAARRGTEIRIEPVLDLESCRCDTWILERLERSVAAVGVRPLRLPSGAGHDGMAMRHLTGIGMMFVRCRGGVSHSPEEAVAADDVGVAARALLHFIENFQPRGM